MKLFFLILATLATINYSFSQVHLSDEDEKAIRLVMSMQEDAWNAGDIGQFMEGYWKSQQLVFVGASGITYGWSSTKENYIKRYPDLNAMGELTFEIIHISRIDKSTVLLLGGFNLKRIEDGLSGYFTLLWKKIDNEWLIISDHTSSKN